ncbi:MAG TPA: 2-polyprenyl-3-methyl-6-methoxy-1,4-benzoquinone monooxygenase [Patescibacteria group bacterium]|nr:2-polyprenyl-3-methyl-6-methoxy-1,4-benzoquinone monooxygenase [Gammaproteobacteria bacterium]HWA51430.1 2-polyprenyl-3-methyl-6-methoxy-1,4-benzoquinone monooxygenase [Patescibacteria group bacterium]
MSISKLRNFTFLDRCLMQFDQSLRTLFNSPSSIRPNPAANLEEPALSSAERKHSAGLLRVNHAGEISAQALYQAQALMSRSTEVARSLEQSAEEENDHLAWCNQRLQELGAHPSYLNPFWYLGSFTIGLVAGLAGDAWNLGFVAETERQVVNHLERHLQKLPAADSKSRHILQKMQEDEGHHASVAMTAGAVELPEAIKFLMKCFSRVMTRTAYWV